MHPTTVAFDLSQVLEMVSVALVQACETESSKLALVLSTDGHDYVEITVDRLSGPGFPPARPRG